MTRTTLILGAGISAMAVAQHALSQGDRLTIYASEDNEKNRAATACLKQAGAHVVYGSQEVIGHYDRCIVSPGIAQTSAFYQSAQAACGELMSEPEYAWRLSPQGWIAITGTNGKTTTTLLIAHILHQCNKIATACGNIGNTTLEAVERRQPGELLVAELSSFQIASMSRFTPRTAVLLNITPDHIAWHGSFEAYAKAKFHLFDRMADKTCAIVSENVVGQEAFVEKLRRRHVHVITIGKKRNADCAWADENGMLMVDLGTEKPIEVLGVDELSILGAHNVENALASAAVALDLGCNAQDVADALRSFKPLEHRIEPCGQINGVSFFNDSKATNVDATIKALSAFTTKQVVLLVGGRDKGTRLDGLVDACCDPCSAVICYGEAGARFAEAFTVASLRTELVKGLDEAFVRACEIAKPGQAIVLSPACSSFDEFDSFEKRGQAFKDLIVKHRARRD